MRYFVRHTLIRKMMSLIKRDDPYYPVPDAPEEGVLMFQRDPLLPAVFQSPEAAQAAIDRSLEWAVKYIDNRVEMTYDRKKLMQILSEEDLLIEQEDSKRKRKGKSPRNYGEK
jgi:hypothetical protein